MRYRVDDDVAPRNWSLMFVLQPRSAGGCYFAHDFLVIKFNHPHWDAIASAIPWYVMLLFFHRSAVGGM